MVNVAEKLRNVEDRRRKSKICQKDVIEGANRNKLINL